MKWSTMLLVLVSGCLAVYLIASGIREASEDKIASGMICGGVALLWMLMEGDRK